MKRLPLFLFLAALGVASVNCADSSAQAASITASNQATPPARVVANLSSVALADTGYLVEVSASINVIPTGQSFTVLVLVPFDLSAKQADALIRQQVADLALFNWNAAIDPADIYFPMAN